MVLEKEYYSFDTLNVTVLNCVRVDLCSFLSLSSL